MVIDDDHLLHDALCPTLQSEGFEVLHAYAGRDGLRLVKETRPVAVTLDIVMPDIDGWSVLKALKADPDTCDIPVILVSMADGREMGFSLGAADFLTKPIDAKRLSSALTRCVEPTDAPDALVVDDDPAPRALLRRMLERGGWRVAEARDGAEGLEAMRRIRPHVVLLDIMMPRMDGFEVLDAVKADPEIRDIPVVAVSAKDFTAEETVRLHNHVAKVLRKGAYERGELLAFVRDEVERATQRGHNAERWRAARAEDTQGVRYYERRRS